MRAARCRCSWYTAGKKEKSLTAKNANYTKGNRIVGAGLKPARFEVSGRKFAQGAETFHMGARRTKTFFLV